MRRNTVLRVLLFVGCVFVLIYLDKKEVERVLKTHSEIGVTKNSVFPSILVVVPTSLYTKYRIKTILDTWYVDNNFERVDIVFFAAQLSCNVLRKEFSNVRFVCGNVADEEYPPVFRNVEMLQLVSQESERYEWILKVDDDTYVNYEKLIALTETFADVEHAFLGSRGTGTSRDRDHLSLKKPFCLGGPGYLIKTKTLRVVSPHLKHCALEMKKEVANVWHSDIVISKCILNYTGLGCWEHSRMNDKALRYNSAAFKNHYADTKHLYDTVTYHPLKTKTEMMVYHERNKCVVNPAVHYDLTGEIKPECDPAGEFSYKSFPLMAFILSLDPDSKAVTTRQHFLESKGVTAVPFEGVDGNKKWGHEYNYVYDTKSKTSVMYHTSPRTGKVTFRNESNFLTAGERGYRMSMLNLFTHLMSVNFIGSIIVLDDDVYFRCDLIDRMTTLLSNPRCGGHVYSNVATGGVLLLGSTIWSNGTFPKRGNYVAGWRLTDADLEWAKQRDNTSQPLCFNAHRKSVGSFAVIYHFSVFPEIVKWLNNHQTQLKPYDHIFSDISKAGHVVRVAYPPIAIPEVRHKSMVDPHRKKQNNMTLRLKLHRWGKMASYCDPITTRPLK